MSNFLRDASLFQNVICQVTRHDRYRDRESMAADLAVPHLVATLAMTHKGATVNQQDVSQLQVETAAHALHGDARSCILNMAKLNAASAIKSNTVCKRNFRRYLPKPGCYRFVAGSFGYHVQRIARRNPHTACSIKDDVGNKRRRRSEIGAHDVVHGLSLHGLRRARIAKFLALALDFQAVTLVSSDADLLVLHPWHEIPILTPAVFLTTLSMH